MPENDKQPSGLKLKKSYYKTAEQPDPAAPENQPESPAAGGSAPTPFHRKRFSPARKWQSILILAGWLLCIALSAALIYLRFFAALPGPLPVLLPRYGVIAIGLIYLFSIMLAIHDNMFDGLLAVVVPFYPLYYLYVNSGSIFLRAIATALLAGFGYDFLLLVQKYALQAFDAISHWIAHV